MESRLNDQQVSRLGELAGKLKTRGTLPLVQLCELAALEKTWYGDLADEERRLRRLKIVLGEPDQSVVSPPLLPADRDRLENLLRAPCTVDRFSLDVIHDYIRLLQQTSQHVVTLNRWLGALPDASETHAIEPLPSPTTAPVTSTGETETLSSSRRHPAHPPGAKASSESAQRGEHSQTIAFDPADGNGSTDSPRFSRFGNDPRVIVADGVRYLPVSLAAWVAQTSDPTVRRWIDQAVSFDGKGLEIYVSRITRQLYLSEASVKQLEMRFLKWPSQRAAGPVTIGETKNKTGYIAVPDVARLIGVSTVSMWAWASKGVVATTRQSLDVIRCAISDQLYVREKDVYELAESRRDLKIKGARKRRRSAVSSTAAHKLDPL